MSERTQHARTLFAPLGPSYDRMGALLSFGQDPLWRRFLVSRLPAPAPAPAEPPPALSSRLRRADAGRGGHVLDVATGTGLVAAELLGRGFRVTGVDQSAEMLAVANRRFDGGVELVEASAESLPFPDSSFDHLTFTYLLRYVDDPGATLAELARVVKAGGLLASLEFGVPDGPARPLWDLYVNGAMPLAGRVVGHGWAEVGDFLAGSIRSFWERCPLERQLELWSAAGLRDVQVRRLSLGAAVVMWGWK
jgi:demethylmenaquinone methyltransferase / 2-methoxy-6-polyprenyl-1,4-benzoquinol methylase